MRLLLHAREHKSQNMVWKRETCLATTRKAFRTGLHIFRTSSSCALIGMEACVHAGGELLHGCMTSN